MKFKQITCISLISISLLSGCGIADNSETTITKTTIETTTEVPAEETTLSEDEQKKADLIASYSLPDRSILTNLIINKLVDFGVNPDTLENFAFNNIEHPADDICMTDVEISIDNKNLKAFAIYTNSTGWSLGFIRNADNNHTYYVDEGVIYPYELYDYKTDTKIN